MATVYRARDLKHDRAVAIKVMRPEISVSADRFLREIRTSARLQHPNILALYDSGNADGVLYYVMPFVQGESLRDRIDREKQLPLSDVITITREVGQALSHAHSLGIIHRDIKPENILLQGGHALVADFGIARAMGDGGGDKLTGTGMSIGTPAYMSPEQSQGSENVDARSDLYSLACVVYEMLIGQPPFTGPTAMAVMARHSLEAVPSLQIVRSAIPDELEDAIMQALAKTPADRFSTVYQFLEALPLPEEVTTAARRRITRASTATPRRRRLPRKTILLGAGVVLLVLVVAGGAWWWRKSRSGARAGGGLDPHRVAVLYFDDLSPNKDLQFVADGFTEALIHELSQVGALQVISRNGVVPYRNRRMPPDSIARELKVGTLVQGTVAQSAGRLRLSVALINGTTGSELGSKTLERPREQTFALQDDVAKEVSQFLRERLGQEILVQDTRAGTGSLEAWELVQQAQQVGNDADRLIRSGEPVAAVGQLLRADSLFAGAQALDKSWVVPVVQRGWLAYRQSRLYGTSDRARAAEWIPKGLVHAEAALKLQSNDPDALELRGTLQYWRYLLNLDPALGTKLRDMAESDFRASVAANPDQASAWTSLTHLLMNKSETAEAKMAAMRAYEADPYLAAVNTTIWRLFFSSLDLGDHAEAKHWCEEGRRRFEKDPRFAECQLWLFSLKDEKPDVNRAWQLVKEYVALSSPQRREFWRLRGQMLVAIALARAGLADSARHVAERSRADATIDPTRDAAWNEAIVRNLVGDRDEALRLLSTFFAANPQQRAALSRDQTWWFRNLWDDPRYKGLAAGAR